MPKSTQWSACTAQRSDGSFCDAKSLPDAPFPICVHHASQIYGFLHRTVDDKFRNLDVDITTVQWQLQLNGVSMADYRPNDPAAYTIYYLRVGELIKIGTTTCLSTRLHSYPPGMTTVLATEPGGFELEKVRLDQFRDLRHSGREWFNPGPSLIEHINAVREAHGDGAMAA